MLEIYQYICFASIIIIIINVWGFYSFVASKENVNISIYSWCYSQQNWKSQDLHKFKDKVE